MYGYQVGQDGTLVPIKIDPNGNSTVIKRKGSPGKMKPKKFRKKPRNRKGSSR